MITLFFIGAFACQVQYKNPLTAGFCVPKEGFEPSLPNGNYALNVARLPVPPLRQAECILSQKTVLSTVGGWKDRWQPNSFL